MQLEILGAEVFSPDFSSQIMSAWESFMIKGKCDQHNIRKVILSSWERCRNNQVPPHVTEAPVAATGDNLYILQEEHRDLLDVTQEVVSSLQTVLSQSRSVLLITDPQGVILDAYGDPATKESGAEHHIAPGGHWDEHVSGTNAIGTAIASGSPVQVHALEHYCEGVKAWTCSAALVRDSQGEDILGAVDISGFDDTFNVHSLALAISIATQIEAILKGREAKDRIKLLEWCSTQTSKWQSDGFIILDTKGRLINSNEKSTEALRRQGITQQVVRGQHLPGVHRGLNRRAVDFPAWIREEWIQPINIDGRHLGTLLVIPHNEPKTKKATHATFHTSPNISMQQAQSDGFDCLIGVSEVMRAAIDRARRFSLGTLPVLLLGETGVGKEEFAKAIHDSSSVKNGPFVAVNCGAFAKDLVSSELFGYADGAFTGAAKGGRRGKFEEADGGTLFLDEVGELPLDVQPHLLRVLQDSMVTRIGENQSRKVKVRIISATNRDLRAIIASGRFREDLYYRLAVATLSLPPLRTRQCDIPLLIEHFLEKIALQTGCPVKTASVHLRQALTVYPWPGNIRQLKNVLESMCQLTESSILDISDLPPELQKTDSAQLLPNGITGLKAQEREIIIATIDRYGGNLRQAARALGIARSTLYEKMRNYGIRRAFISSNEDTYPESQA